MFSILKTAFSRSLKTYPVLTNTSIYATFYLAAEFSQQSYKKYFTYLVLMTSLVVGLRYQPYVGLCVEKMYNITCLMEEEHKTELELKPEKPEYDYAAAARVAGSGSMLYAPTLYYWYKYLDKKFTGTSMRVVLTKVFADQLFMTPILLAGFFTLNSILERKENIFEELQQKYWKTFLANQTFWMPAQIINFYFLPNHLRVVYVASASFIWINILCYIKRQKIKSSHQN